MNPNKRLLSLDVLRGITVAGMILVNNTGKCGYNFAAFAHAKWDGFSPADLVFPMFMFLMGISTYISLCKYNFQCRPAIAKIIKRSLLLIFIGLVMEWFITAIDSGNYFDLSQLRLMGVMQRLGICYGITALLAVTIPHKRFMPLAIILLIVYFIFQLFGNGFEKSADNIVGIVDSAILGSNHMYLQGRQFVDPEGILSTIPAVSQVMIGFVCGKIIIDIIQLVVDVVQAFVYLGHGGFVLVDSVGHFVHGRYHGVQELALAFPADIHTLGKTFEICDLFFHITHS